MESDHPETGQADAQADLDVGLLEYLQTLTPAQRIARIDQAAQLVRALRKAGADHYGFDPRASEESR